MEAPTCLMDLSESNTAKKSIITLRRCLLIWAYCRLTVSIFWSGILFSNIPRSFYQYFERNSFTEDLVLALFATVELGMIQTFIVAGHKKSAKLYRIYFYYCIAALCLYIIETASSVSAYSDDIMLDYYITFHIGVMNHSVIVIGVICLEILLILLVKRLRNKYKCKPEVAWKRKHKVILLVMGFVTLLCTGFVVLYFIT